MASFRVLSKVLPVACGIAAIVGLTWLPTDARAATVVVTAATPNGWAFDNRDANGIVGAEPTASGGFVPGPAVPPLGTGSANLKVGNGVTGGDGTSELRNVNYSGVALSTISILSYSTYATQNNGQQFPYLGLMIATSGSGSPDDILFFEPPYQTPGSGNPSLPNQGASTLLTWQSWDARNGGWWANSGDGGCNPGTGVCALSDYLAVHPNAAIVNTDDGLGGIRFNVGFASSNDQFNGYIDAFTINDTTYDFEAAAATPIPATLPLFGSGLGLIGLLGWRRKRQRLPPAA